MKALISPNEVVEMPDGATGQRVAQVETNDKIFPVSLPLFWMDCDDFVIADQWYYSNEDQTIRQIPVEMQLVTVNPV